MLETALPAPLVAAANPAIDAGAAAPAGAFAEALNRAAAAAQRAAAADETAEAPGAPEPRGSRAPRAAGEATAGAEALPPGAVGASATAAATASRLQDIETCSTDGGEPSPHGDWIGLPDWLAAMASPPLPPAQGAGAAADAAAIAAALSTRAAGAASDPGVALSPGGAVAAATIAADARIAALATIDEAAAAGPERAAEPWAASMPPPLLQAMVAAGPAATPSLFEPEQPLPAQPQAFAPALASQLSVLMRDGIEHARLQLNPAELGPIEVRISLDGSAAQVDFAAAHALTRQALQDAVPALAAALRESGFTLAGGGVFEQPRESRGETPGRAPTSTAAAEEAVAAEAAVPRTARARGIVDLYA